jgi:NAD+ synthase
LTASPTDGLFGDDRTDEDQLGRPIELEWAMTQDEAGQTAASFSGRDRVYLKFTND